MSKFAEKLKNDLEEDEEQQEYQEVQDPKDIKAILKAELSRKSQPQTNTLLIQNKQIENKNKDKPLRKEKPLFVKDDRQREIALQYKQKVQKSQEQKKQPEKQISRGKDNSHNKTHSAKKYVAKEELNKIKENSSKKNKKIDEVEINYVQKSKQNQNEKSKFQRVKFNKEQSEKTVKPKRQFYEQKGEEIQLELINQWKDFDNSIYVGKKDTSIYVQKAAGMLKIFKFIVLRSFAIYVQKAFLVAGLLAEKYPGLNQLSIPSTVEVFMITKQGQKRRSRGAIEIELSVKQKQLDQKHIGYQLAHEGSRKQKRVQYKQKQSAKVQEKKGEKKLNYIEKAGKRPRTLSQEQQLQRELR